MVKPLAEKPVDGYEDATYITEPTQLGVGARMAFFTLSSAAGFAFALPR
jgi:hypothetical protein